MARLMAFDFGSKRLGLAVSDPHQLIAVGLTTLHPKDIVDFLKQYLATEEVASFIVGDPRQADHSPSQTAPQVQAFINLLKRSFPAIPIFMVGERNTTQEALHSLQTGGFKKKDRRRKELVDKMSAVILLQRYMEQIGNFG